MPMFFHGARSVNATQRLGPGRPTSPGRQGIALVVVLGFLSALILLAVAFSIIMRTERLASRNYNDQVRGRQLVHAALARVIADQVRTNMAGRVYPAWEAIHSQYDGRLGPDFIAEDGAPYIPGALTNAAYLANLAEWVPMRDPDPQDNKFYGEYAFLVVNNSGLLDANFVASTARGRGVEPGEIRAVTNVMAELTNNTLASARSTIKRFESIVELYQLGLAGANLGGFAKPRPSHYMNNFHIYSRFPRGYAAWDPTAGWVANVNVFQIPTNYPWTDEQSAACSNALTDLWPNPIPDLEAFMNAMRDYMNNRDYIPAGVTDDKRFKRFSANAVPMINEIMVTNSLRRMTANELQVQVHVVTETWYPFPSNAVPNFTLHVPTPQLTIFPYVQKVTPSPSSPPTIEHHGYDYCIRTNTFNYSIPLPVFISGQYIDYPPIRTNPPPQQPLPLRIRVEMPGTAVKTIEVWDSADNPVDRVYGPWQPEQFDSTVTAGDLPALPVGDATWRGFAPMIGLSTDDPRINWDVSNKAQWDSISVTPEAENLKIDNAPERPLDEFGRMYTRRGHMESVGEVGYLLYDDAKPWHTVRLLGPDPDGTARILDRLTVSTNAYSQGLVNINTRQTNALTALFFQMPIENHPPPQNVSSNLSATNAFKLATNMVSANITLGPMVNYSDIAARWSTNYMAQYIPAPAHPGDTKFVGDSFVRNSIGLWGTRHNLFTVFVAARVFSEMYNPNDAAMLATASNYVVGEQRAVAVLWRDPYITADQYGTKSNENFIRFFHWLVMLFEE